MSERHRRQSSSCQLSRRLRAGVLLSVLCILAMPSVYRGGAEEAHAHAFLQVVVVGPERAMHHHHDGDHDESAPASSETHDHALCIKAGLTAPSPAPVQARDHTHGIDEPSIAPVEATGGSTAMIAYGLESAWVLPPQPESLMRYATLDERAAGLAESPESPPPEVAAHIS